MNKKILATALVLCLILLPVSIGYGAYNNWHGSDRNQLLFRELPTDLIYKGVKRGGVSDIVSTVSKLISTHLAFSLLRLSGASKTFTMDEGEVGQSITLLKSEYDARTLSLSFQVDAIDTTHTGFTSVTWPTKAGDFVTLEWPSDALGWILTAASSGMTITYAE